MARCVAYVALWPTASIVVAPLMSAFDPKRTFGSTVLHTEPIARPLLPARLRYLAHQLGPIHRDCFINLAGLGSSVVFEDLDHKSRVVREDDASLHHP